jgi:predicted TIM-barrel fold metal-dependent hydrolase
MYRLLRTARVRGGGRLGEAIAWARDVAEYVTAQYPLVQVQAFTQRFGTVGAIYWTIDVDSEDLAELDRFLNEVAQDTEYNSKIAEAAKAELFVPGSVQDTLLQSL